MQNPIIFDFNSDISGVLIPKELNNSFGLDIPKIGKIAAKEFQEFIRSQSPKWNYDFATQRGKMFGVLVVQKTDKSLGYLGAMSGVFPGGKTCSQFVPSVFNTSTDGFFINKGMTELTEMGKVIKSTTNPTEINKLTEARKLKSFALQQRLFENYIFTTREGESKNVLQIFADSTHSNPPAAAGECAAPKLLQYAFSNNLKPIALAEFWWGNPSKSNERKHLSFYPACNDKCKPILEFMLRFN